MLLLLLLLLLPFGVSVSFHRGFLSFSFADFFFSKNFFLSSSPDPVRQPAKRSTPSRRYRSTPPTFSREIIRRMQHPHHLKIAPTAILMRRTTTNEKVRFKKSMTDLTSESHRIDVDNCSAFQKVDHVCRRSLKFSIVSSKDHPALKKNPKFFFLFPFFLLNFSDGERGAARSKQQAKKNHTASS